MKFQLSQTQRFITAAIYLIILILLFNLIGGNIRQLAFNQSIDSSIWFYSGAFMIILGSYIMEPFFSKPSDAIANATAILIALLGLQSK